MESGSEPLVIETSTDGGTGRIRVGGELDVHTAPSLSDAVADVFAGGLTSLVIDATDLRFCDSSGIQVLVQARERAIEAGGTVSLTGVHGPVEKVLTVTGLLELFV